VGNNSGYNLATAVSVMETAVQGQVSQLLLCAVRSTSLQVVL